MPFLHRQRQYKVPGLLAAVGLKTCTKCINVEDISSFARDKTRHDGKTPWCKDCQKHSVKNWRLRNLDHVLIANKEWKNNNRDKALAHSRACKNRRKQRNPIEWQRRQREQNLSFKYGLSIEKLERIVTEQDGCCAICGIQQGGTKYKRLCVDHCHSSKRIRGLLCHNCNHLLGHAKDNSEILYNAAKYLENHYANE